jgi:hypothetical protein
MVIRKKAALGLPFHWIFVLVAGTVILGFFFSVVYKQKDITEQKVSYRLITDLEAIISSAAQAKDTVQAIELPNTRIVVECSDECSCEMSIGGVPRDFEDTVLFSPKTLEGNSIIFWTQDWNVPYRAANFLYLSTDKTKFYLVTDNPEQQIVKFVKDRLPDEINYEIISSSAVSSLTNKNFVKVKFVFFDGSPSSVDIDEFSDANPSAVSIQGTDITFYERSSKRKDVFDESFTASFDQEEMLFGAIFADDFNNYACSTKTAFKKLHYVAEVYDERTKELAKKNLTGCNYDNNNLEKIKTSAKNVYKGEIGKKASSSKDWNTKIPGIADDIRDVEEQNKALLRKSCPTIY